MTPAAARLRLPPLRPRRAAMPARPGGEPAIPAHTVFHGLAPLTDQRIILHRLLAGAGVVQPRLLGVVGRAGGFDARRDVPLPDLDVQASFLAGLDAPFALRPASVRDALPTRVLRPEDGELVDAAGVRRSAVGLAHALRTGPAELVIVVEALQNHPALGAAAPLTPVDVVTEVGAGGAVAVRGVPEAAHAAGVADLVRRAAAVLVPLRRVRWSVALTPDGPRVLGARREGAT